MTDNPKIYKESRHRYGPEEPYVDEFGERINRGRSYKSYLAEQYPHLTVKKIRDNLKEK